MRAPRTGRRSEHPERSPATGGYGRGVLAPFSDIDLLFLTAGRTVARRRSQVVEYMLYFLWDLGLKVGHATRSIDDCLSEGAKDITIRTALLDARHLAGDAALVRAIPSPVPRRLQGRPVRRSTSPPSRPSATARHRRYGDSPFVVEPNIKEGRGGLRDLQTLYWIARYVFEHPDHGRARRRRPAC